MDAERIELINPSKFPSCSSLKQAQRGALFRMSIERVIPIVPTRKHDLAVTDAKKVRSPFRAQSDLANRDSDTMVGVATSGEPEPGERRSMTDDRVNTREVQSAEENLETHEDDAVTLSDVSSIKAVRTLNDPKEPQQASSPIVDLSEGPLAFILHLSLHESGRAVDEHMPSSELPINTPQHQTREVLSLARHPRFFPGTLFTVPSLRWRSRSLDQVHSRQLPTGTSKNNSLAVLRYPPTSCKSIVAASRMLSGTQGQSTRDLMSRFFHRCILRRHAGYQHEYMTACSRKECAEETAGRHLEMPSRSAQSPGHVPRDFGPRLYARQVLAEFDTRRGIRA
ncbi:hypothetical protein KCU89_g155, partial [Aureobasidium melanogenum]